MTIDLAVVTPSFAPDEPLFADLHASVLRHTDPSTVHHVIVPPGDRALFARYEGDRCRVWSESEVLPSRYRRLRKGWWVDVRRPWPPVRGWVLQQALKLAVTAQLDVRTVLVADSDVVLIRRVDPARFRVGGRLPVYRVDGAVHAGMARHLTWHSVAHRLLGLDPPPRPPLPDYVSSLNLWSPETVRAIQQRIAEVTGRDWFGAFTAQLHISEFILYGVYVDLVASAGGERAPADTELCLDYWDRVPLDAAAADALAARLGDRAFGLMISAKSGTPMEIRRRAAARCAEIVAGSA